MDGVSAVATNLSVIGRYWWNIQMKLLQKVGIMPVFKAYSWLFWVVGFLLLAFLYPLGVAFVVSAFCAGTKDPKAENDFIVPLRGARDEAEVPTEVTGLRASSSVEDDKADHHGDEYEDLYLAAGTAHVSFLNAMERELSDEEFSAAALGAFDGAVQALRVELTHVEMFSMGAAFIVRQLKDLERMADVDPEGIANLTAEAMNSSTLQGIREQAGQVAYSVTVKMRSA